jgi:hypothetical protein
MTSTQFSISFDVEPIVKLMCEDTKCLYHLVKKPGGWMACDLKHITIQRGGMCASRQVKTPVVEWDVETTPVDARQIDAT